MLLPLPRVCRFDVCNLKVDFLHAVLRAVQLFCFLFLEGAVFFLCPFNDFG
ncbi:hypothetical protein Barb6_03138 [Bacteroidales bacterium Barb6]|nr:hypothetical protein Barb6_03138 [Bacteroidales bacterium Barb6]